ncbi:hypothetical protein CRYUN_Cryun05aG0036400 [Craigia yunnanensis]
MLGVSTAWACMHVRVAGATVMHGYCVKGWWVRRSSISGEGTACVLGAITGWMREACPGVAGCTGLYGPSLVLFGLGEAAGQATGAGTCVHASMMVGMMGG